MSRIQITQRNRRETWKNVSHSTSANTYFNIKFSVMQNILMAQLPCWAAAGFQRGGIGKIFSPGEINRVLGPR